MGGDGSVSYNACTTDYNRGRRYGITTCKIEIMSMFFTKDKDMYIFWPHRSKKGINHFLQQNLCDLGLNTPLRRQMSRGDRAVFCITTTGDSRVWARAELAGPVFALLPHEVADPNFPLAVPLLPGSVQWCWPSWQQQFPWHETRRISEEDCLQLTGNKQWRNSPPPTPDQR